LVRAWRHPERVGSFKTPPLHVELGRKLLTLVASAVAARVTQRVLPPPPSRA
jgi:hypothetical protein